MKARQERLISKIMNVTRTEIADLR